jgi:hypothetical protein
MTSTGKRIKSNDSLLHVMHTGLVCADAEDVVTRIK